MSEDDINSQWKKILKWLVVKFWTHDVYKTIPLVKRELCELSDQLPNLQVGGKPTHSHLSIHIQLRRSNMLSQEDIQKYYIANSNRKSVTPQFNIYGCWSDTKQIVPSTVAIENKDKTNEILGHLSLGKIVHAVFRSHNTPFYDNLRLTQGQNKNITFNNVKYDYVCEFEIESDKVLTFIQNTKMNTKPVCIYTIYVCTKMEEVIYTKLNDKVKLKKHLLDSMTTVAAEFGVII